MPGFDLVYYLRLFTFYAKPLSKTPTWFYVSWLFQIAAAGLLFLVAFEKLRGSPATVEIFTKLRLEPWGRYSAAVTEVLVGLCLVLPWLVWAGSIMGISLALGALFFHGALLGIEVGGDGGANFYAAMAVSMLSIIVLYLRLLSVWPGVAPGPVFMQDRAIAEAMRRIRGKKQ